MFNRIKCLGPHFFEVKSLKNQADRGGSNPVIFILELIFHEISLPFTGEYREHLDILAPRATIYLGGLDSDSNFAEHMVAV